jgi:hypothetical protein
MIITINRKRIKCVKVGKNIKMTRNRRMRRDADG